MFIDSNACNFEEMGSWLFILALPFPSIRSVCPTVCYCVLVRVRLWAETSDSTA